MESITEQQLKLIEFEKEISMRELAVNLSGGDRQLIAFSRARYFGVDLLVLDEPTSAISEDRIQKILNLIRKLKRDGVSIVFITHKAEEVFRIADRFVILQNGRNYTSFSRADTNLKELEKLFIYSRLTAMRELVASIAHQLKNPLAVIQLSVEVLKDDFDVSSNKNKYNKLIEVLLDDIQNMHKSINKFLNFAKPLKYQAGYFLAVTQ